MLKNRVSDEEFTVFQPPQVCFWFVCEGQ